MKKVVVGKRMTKADLILNVLFALFWLGGPYILLGIFFKNFHGLQLVKSSILFFILTLPLFIFMFYRFLTDIIMLQYLEVTEERLIFNEVSNRQAATEEAIAILRGCHYQPSITIELKDIISVKISCRRSLGVRGLPRVVLILECLLQDGSEVRIVPTNMASKKGDYYRVVELMEACGVYISDPYELKPALEGDNIYFQEYVLKHHKGESTL